MSFGEKGPQVRVGAGVSPELGQHRSGTVSVAFQCPANTSHKGCPEGGTPQDVISRQSWETLSGPVLR